MNRQLGTRISDQNSPSREQFIRKLRSHYWPVYRFVLSLVPQPSDADDVMQEVSVILWEKFEEFDPETNFLAWANRVALNVARNHLRTQKRLQAKMVSSETLSLIAHTQRGVSELLEMRRVFLAECLEELPLEKRRLIRQRYLENHSPDELASHSGQKTANIYLQLSRVRKALMDCINRKIKGRAH